MIELHKVSKSYSTEIGIIPALDPIDFSLKRSETVALVGPSGCGKSTLLLLLACLEAPTSGKMTFSGDNDYTRKRETALMLQEYGLFPWKTVRKNIELGLRIRKEIIDQGKIDLLLEDLDIADKVNLYPQQLSGGQKQRVALARSMLLNPSLLLLDEPFAALDTLTRERLQDLLIDTWKKRRFSMVLATHNIQEAVMLGQRIIIMAGNPGRLVTEIDNPSCSKEHYRGSDEFYAVAKKIRQELSAVL